MNNINIIYLDLVDVPVPFGGTKEEADANFATHSFDPEYARCLYCDCRPWGAVANYPCGAEVPRELRRVER